jgi:hypothetical protein
VRQELTVLLSGPEFDRARILAREAISSVVLGGPAAEPSLEFVLTETRNRPAVGATFALLLATVAGNMALLVADGERRNSPQSDSQIREDAMGLLDEMLDLMGEQANA